MSIDRKQRGRLYKQNRVPYAPKPAGLVLGIDPGVGGAFVLTDGVGFLRCWDMPLLVIDKDRMIDFDRVHEILYELLEEYRFHVMLERAIPMAMGSKGAFNYGRGFAAIEIAISLHEIPVTYIEPSKWAKDMHEGLSTDLRPKAKSLMAVRRLYPKLVSSLPTTTKGTLKDGPVDALLIAGYGIRKGLAGSKRDADVGDFY